VLEDQLVMVLVVVLNMLLVAARSAVLRLQLVVLVALLLVVRGFLIPNGLTLVVPLLVWELVWAPGTQALDKQPASSFQVCAPAYSMPAVCSGRCNTQK
jgi:hypothetical protein